MEERTGLRYTEELNAINVELGSNSQLGGSDSDSDSDDSDYRPSINAACLLTPSQASTGGKLQQQLQLLQQQQQQQQLQRKKKRAALVVQQQQQRQQQQILTTKAMNFRYNNTLIFFNFINKWIFSLQINIFITVNLRLKIFYRLFVYLWDKIIQISPLKTK